MKKQANNKKVKTTQSKNTQGKMTQVKNTQVKKAQAKSKEENYKIVHQDRGELIRLNKYISETGICSRREADKLIESRRVTIDGVVAEMGTRVKENTDVKVDGRSIKKVEELVYIALNKPVGITCTTERNIKGNIIDFVRHKKRIFPIGRLDKDSQGLILLTNDGDIVNKILRAGNNHEKEYIVTVNKPITDEFIKDMAKGVKILGTVTKECKVKRQSKFIFNIILTEGMNRQIRRMCEALDYKVMKLERIRIMNIKLDNIKMGKYRELTSNELKYLNELIGNSRKTTEINK